MKNKLESQLVQAINANDIHHFQILLADVNIDLWGLHFPNQGACIHYAAQKGRLELVTLLLDKEPNLLNHTDGKNQTPILWAARRGFLELVNFLAYTGADLNCVTHSSVHHEQNKAPIHWATERGYTKIVECLISYGAFIDLRCYDDMHLLHIAALYDRVYIAIMLLNKNLECLNYFDSDTKTPLIYAIESGSENLVRKFVELGADFQFAKKSNQDDADYEYFPIHYAIENGHSTIFKYLYKCMEGKDPCLGVEQKKFIHLAALHGHLDIVQYLLKKNPDSIESADIFGSTPLMYAASNDSYEVVKFLLEKGVDTNKVTINPTTLQHERCALSWAVANKSYRCANLLLLHNLAKKDKRDIFNFIKVGEQVFDLMLDEPSFIPLVLQDENMLSLINETTNFKNTANKLQWYKKEGRRASFFASINKNTNTASQFCYSKDIGHGTFGTVRLFQSEKGEEVVVKTPIKNVVDVLLQKNALAKESTFNQIAYQGEYSSAFEFESEDDYTNRYVMPFVPGDTLYSVMPKINCKYQLAELILQIAYELTRIHSLGFLHRDIHAKNIMIAVSDDGFKVRFVDFALSCWLTEDAAECWIVEDNKFYPPELCAKKEHYKSFIPKLPNVNQDIYSFGFLLKCQLANHPLCQELMNDFPFIMDFINQSLDVNPENRPALGCFCETLKAALDNCNVSEKSQCLSM